MAEALRVALAGLGTVGSGVIRVLEANRALIERRAGRAIEVVAVSARDRGKDRGVDISGFAWVDDTVALADADADVVVELVGGADGPALALARATPGKGQAFVTANKAMLAHHGLELEALVKLAVWQARPRIAARQLDDELMDPLAPGIDAVHRHSQTTTDFAEPVFVAHAHTVKHDNPSVTAQVAHGVDDTWHGKAGSARVHEKAGDAALVARRGLGVRQREHHRIIGVRRVGDPLLGTGEHPLIAVAHGARLHAEYVRAGVGLAQAEAQGLVAAGDAVSVAIEHLGVQMPQHRR